MNAKVTSAAVLAILIVGIVGLNTVYPFIPSLSQNPCSVQRNTGSLAALLYGQNTPEAPPQISTLVVPPGCTATLTGVFELAVNNTAQATQAVQPQAFLAAGGANGTFAFDSRISMTVEPDIVPTNAHTPAVISISVPNEMEGVYYIGLYGGVCPGFRLAVGSGSTQLNASDWPGGANPFRGCYQSPVLFVPVGVTEASVQAIA